ncbi:hypothetical protein A8C32_18605 [Flavivirga aquatica]|uniref:Secretion system C-terminal sorting domain-containing protein n=1 Tax=Flavivirga aquatica TaxID=1849968 RepID=A0A1E5T449_9FLAO|nr:T9SS type A sorting domain-containing protein [Flavivirga aquatica]OEK06047.1 hypothetical protein A8C32_18605 [Flavivirga aquatica]
MKLTETFFAILLKGKIIATIILISSFGLVKAQENCELEQKISISRSLNDCGDGGLLRVDLSNGKAPYNVNIKDIHSGISRSGIVSGNSFNVKVFAGTFEMVINDANKCSNLRIFNVFAKNFVIEPLECLENGRRRVRFSNNSNSFIPVKAEMGGFGFSLQRGTSNTLEVPPGTYTFKISREGCEPYDLTFTVDNCPSSKAKNSAVIKNDRNFEIISDLSNSESNGKIYPNPFSNNFTLDMLDMTQYIKGSSKTAEAFKVLIYNIEGKKVYGESFKNLKKNINLSHLNSGSYFIKVISENGLELFTKKIVKN